LKYGRQAENGIICTSNMSGEMHMRRRRDAGMRYSATYPTGAERIKKLVSEGVMELVSEGVMELERLGVMEWVSDGVGE